MGIELTTGQNSGDTAEVLLALVFPWAPAINITIRAPLSYHFYKKRSLLLLEPDYHKMG